MNLDQKKSARQKLKKHYGASAVALISENTGLSKVYVRRWFLESDLVQPSIEEEVIAMLEKIQAKEQSVKQLLNQ